MEKDESKNYDKFIIYCFLKIIYKILVGSLIKKVIFVITVSFNFYHIMASVFMSIVMILGEVNRYYEYKSVNNSTFLILILRFASIIQIMYTFDMNKNKNDQVINQDDVIYMYIVMIFFIISNMNIKMMLNKSIWIYSLYEKLDD